MLSIEVKIVLEGNLKDLVVCENNLTQNIIKFNDIKYGRTNQGH